MILQKLAPLKFPSSPKINIMFGSFLTIDVVHSCDYGGFPYSLIWLSDKNKSPMCDFIDSLGGC